MPFIDLICFVYLFMTMVDKGSKDLLQACVDDACFIKELV